MLIDSRLLHRFWVEVIETANYLQNRIPTRSQNHGKIISEEAWTNKQQNLQYVRIFGSFAISIIPDGKRSKSDYQKVWQGSLIGYNPDTTKYFHV